MAFIYGFLAVAAFYAFLHQFTEINHKQKQLFSAILAFVIAGAYFFEMKNSAEQSHIEAIILKYNQNQTFRCDNIEINSSSFNLSSRTFVAKESSMHTGRIIPISTCE